jgi:hypothetical protein
MSKEVLDTTTCGERFQRMFKTLNMNQTTACIYWGVTHPTIRSWIDVEPRFSSTNRSQMIQDGINPLYCDGVGNVTFPEITIDQAIDNVKKRIANPILA